MRSNKQTDRSRGSHWMPLATHSNFKRGVGLTVGLAIFAGLLGFVPPTPAVAAECNQDIGVLMKKRQGIIDQLNKLAKASPKGQLDPVASCPKLRILATAEQELAAYLTKNKDWCMVPDSAVTNIQASSKHTKAIAAKACQVAEQIKKGQAANAAAAPKLPTGPL
jgi:hypothetical protein